MTKEKFPLNDISITILDVVKLINRSPIRLTDARRERILREIGYPKFINRGQKDAKAGISLPVLRSGINQTRV